jgi:hypothetical protein
MEAKKGTEPEAPTDELVFQGVAVEEPSLDELVAKVSEAADEAGEQPSQRELMNIIAAMRDEILVLKEATDLNSRRISTSYDHTDDKFFICKPNSQKWTERRVVDRKPVSIDFVATGFIGPFDTKEDIEQYLSVKNAGRDGENAPYWASVYTLTGREARELRVKERDAREQGFDSSVPLHVLDQKIFSQHSAPSKTGVGAALASTDNAGPAPYQPNG